MALRLSRLVVLPFLAGGLALAGCQRPASRPPCPAGKVCLEYGNTTDPATLDPIKTTLTSEAAIVRELMEGLASNAPDGSPIPGTATSWETSADGLEWTFHLRPARWSDGVPVTAGDFVYAFRRGLDPKTAASYAYLLYVIKGAQAVNAGKAPPESLGAMAVDAHTLRLTLAHPAPYLPQLLQHQSFSPVPAHVVRRWGDAWIRPGHYVGNGPYRLVSWRLGDSLRVEKNPLYYGAAKVCVDRINFYPTQDTVSAERRVKRGELDVNNTIVSSRVAFLRQPGQMAPFVHTHPFLSNVYLAFNVPDVPALRDPRVRQAIGMAIDRAFLTGKLLRAGQIPTTAFVPPQIAGYLPSGAPHPHAYWADWPLAKRQAEARRLLALAGYGPGRPLRVQLKTANVSTSVLIAQAMQADLRDVGIDLTLRQEEGQVAYRSFEAKDFQVGLLAWIADFSDPLTYLTLMKSDTGAQNYGSYANPRFDALLNQADHEPDGARRAEILAQAEQIMLDDAYIAPLYVGVNLNLVSPRVTGWVDNAVDIHPARYLCLGPGARS
ncbi:MAG: peptide transporter substrate-binding protein [Caulobacteraceae bacterium]|nr:peptide transporter substrate-binding protein [Caulobacteraceae bacterium]